MRPVTLVSIVVPMLNEAAYVDDLVADIAAQDVGVELEVLVADGGSSDGSVGRLLSAAKRRGLAVEVLDNPARWVSHGLNLCVRRARGDLIVRLDCHSRYPLDYLRRCVVAAEETGAPAVGGIVVPEGRTPWERAVACAMDSPFGGIGWMRGTTRPMRRETDIFTYGAFRPEAFALAGLFDETLRRNQDDDFTFRLRRAGGRVILDSAIQVRYAPRGSPVAVFRQYFQYGLWKTAVMLKHRRLTSPRGAVPSLFVASLVALAPAAAFLAPARWVLAAEVGAYVALAVASGAASTRRRGESWRLLPRVVTVFPAFHLGYGLGVFAGAIRAGMRNRQARSAPDAAASPAAESGVQARPE